MRRVVINRGKQHNYKLDIFRRQRSQQTTQGDKFKHFLWQNKVHEHQWKKGRGRLKGICTVITAANDDDEH